MLKTNLFRLLAFSAKFRLGALRSNFYYTRNIEYPLCFNKLEIEEGMRVLDVGSGNSMFPIYLAKRNILTYATDIDEYILELKKLAKKAQLEYLFDTGKLNIQVCDVRKLNFPDSFFDRIAAVSTLEHISSNGDVEAIKEMGRVLKSGGKVFLTVEAHNKFMEIPVEHDFYYGYPYKEILSKFSGNNKHVYAHSYREFQENKGLKSVGFLRYYDYESLSERIIKPSGLIVEEVGYFADRRFLFRKLFDTTILGKYLVLFVPLIAKLFYKKTKFEKIRTSDAYLSNAIAFVLLSKP